MRVGESVIAEVVSEVSAQLADTEYVSRQVDELIAVQPNVMQYVVAHQEELAVEGIVQVMLHASIMHRSVERVLGKLPRQVSFSDLNRAATATPDLEALSAIEGDLASYIASNADFGTADVNQLVAKLLCHVAGAFVAAMPDHAAPRPRDRFRDVQ